MPPTALMILVGGRPVPNFLTAQFLRPEIIAPIASHEAMRDGEAWSKHQPVLHRLATKVLDPMVVDAFSYEETHSAASSFFCQLPSANWIVNVTCATTVMSIAAYEVAKEKGLSCWYLDSDSRRVTVLRGAPPGGEVFRVSVSDYIEWYGRKIRPQALESPDEATRKLARRLASDATQTTLFRQSLVKAVSGRRVREQEASKIEIEVSPEGMGIILAAQEAGLVNEVLPLNNGRCQFVLLGAHSLDFLNGGWLEMYVWIVASETGLFAPDELCFSFKIPASGQENEIDFAAASAGTLLIAECKTDANPFKSSYLDKLTAIAGLIGGNFVGKMLVTNQTPDLTNSGVQGFFSQAEAKRVVVVTQNEFPNLATIIKKESGLEKNRPKYFRG